MARPKKIVEEMSVPGPEPVTVVLEEEEEPKGKKAIVYKGLSLVREYTPELHGKGYKALAEEFAGKNSAKGYEVRLK